VGHDDFEAVHIIFGGFGMSLGKKLEKFFCLTYEPKCFQLTWLLKLEDLQIAVD
jgi:hypothetical protein